MSYLDHVAALLRCSCLSDLHFCPVNSSDIKALLNEPETYSLSDYTKAVRYLLSDNTLVFETPAQAKQAIVAFFLSRR